MKVPIGLRPMVSDDRNFIYATWLENYKHSSPIGRLTRPDIYYQGQRAVVDRLIKPENVVLASPIDSDTIIGYVVSEFPCLHYCYVKAPFRKMGVGKVLIESKKFTMFSHWTDDCEWAAKKFGLVYNPFEA